MESATPCIVPCRPQERPLFSVRPAWPTCAVLEWEWTATRAVKAHGVVLFRLQMLKAVRARTARRFRAHKLCVLCS